MRTGASRDSRLPASAMLTASVSATL